MPLTAEQKRQNAIQRTYERYLCLTGGKAKNDCLKTFQELRRLECFEVCESAGLYAECSSCGRCLNSPKECDAGHYISRKRTVTAFSRNNVWAQCKYCNQHLSGNLAEYRKRLIERIGEAEVLLLEAWKDTEVSFSKWQYAQMKEAYRAMVKREKARLGI